MGVQCMDVWMYRQQDGWMEYVGGCMDVYECMNGYIGSIFMNMRM